VPPTLTELAELAGTGKFALLRAFHAAHGLPPYRYLDQLRVREAQRRLAAGCAPAEVAAAVGYVGQAHLSRNFRRIVGVPPGAYGAAHGWTPQPRTRRAP
jgi:AraC-like DNA-binding protein